jgi:hypothetical protein
LRDEAHHPVAHFVRATHSEKGEPRGAESP